MFTPTTLSYAMAFVVGIAVSLIVTPIVRSVARRINFVDNPDGGRKNHKEPVALGGGVAVFLSMLVAIAVTFAFARYQGLDILNFNQGRADRAVFLGLLQASGLIVLLGLIDDKIGMRGRYKLLGQIGVVCLLMYRGLVIERFGLFGEVIELEWLSYPVTFCWLIGTINAINLIDGIDGLASSVGMVLCLTVAAMAAMLGHFAEAVVVLALAGPLLGFLRYNFAPASMYLGDTGSMLIGLVVGAIAAHSSVKSPAAIAMAVPLAVWSIPILDSAAAILRRKLTGRSLFAADRGHLHHSLLIRGWSVQQASLFVTLICATTCLSAVLSMLWGDERIALLIVVAVVLFLISTKTFGHIEFALLKNRFHDSAASISGKRGEASMVRQSAVRLQGSREWDKLWAAMTESAESNRLLKMKLAINIPALHEVYYASWKSAAQSSDDVDLAWSTTHPLMLNGQKVGHLELVGLPDPEQESTPLQMIQVLDFLEPIEDDIRRICEQIRSDQESPDDEPSLLTGTAHAMRAAKPLPPASAGAAPQA
ncbi:MAG: MraY family glycosyltransferase [Planctomycetota bacterium]